MQTRPKNFALIGGLLRDELEFRLTFSRILEARNEGIIDEIVLSTWDGEIDKFPGLRQSLYRQGIHLVEGTMPPQSYGNTWPQNKALDQGLRIIPDDAAVWRLKTDRTSHLLKAFLPSLCSGPPSAQAFGAVTPIFGHKICATAIISSLPFYAADIAFYGMKKDLQKLVTYDGVFDNIFAGFGAEHRLWTQPFLKAFPALQTVYERINIKALSTQVINAARNGSILPTAIVHLYAFYWTNLFANIQTVDKMIKAPDGAMSFVSALGGNMTNGVRSGATASKEFTVQVTAFNHPESIAQLVNSPVSDGTANSSIYLSALHAIKAGELSAPDWTDLHPDTLTDFAKRTLPTVAFQPFRFSKGVAAVDQSQDTQYNDGIFCQQTLQRVVSGMIGSEKISDASLAVITDYLRKLSNGANSGMVYFQLGDYFLSQSLLKNNDAYEAKSLAHLFLLRSARDVFPQAAAFLGLIALSGNLDSKHVEQVRYAVRNAAIRDCGMAQYVFSLMITNGWFSEESVSTADYWIERARQNEFTADKLDSRFSIESLALGNTLQG